jgi:protein TonB
MSATTVNAFPPLHAFNSSRGWFLALIVLLHAGFFWVLTHGVTIGSVKLAPPMIVIDPLPTKTQPPPKPVKPVDPVVRNVWVPTVEQPVLPPDDVSHAPRQVTDEPQPLQPPTVIEGPGSGPLIVEPEIDARFPFTEPEYPVSEIRQGHEGTVLLALQILPNGRVGAVRIDQSSGYTKLDESAAREARRWRMKPGMSDGATMPMWKRVPIKFRLKN